MKNINLLNKEQLPETHPGPVHGKKHLNRRKNLAEEMFKITNGNSSLAILYNGNEKTRNMDVFFPFRPSSDFLYLTGFDEPDSWLFIFIDENNKYSDALFSKKKNKIKEIWDGVIIGQDLAKERFNFKKTFPTEELDKEAVKILKKTEHVFAPFNSIIIIEKTIKSWLESLKKEKRTGLDAPKSFNNLSQILENFRQCKDTLEIETMKKAAKISTLGHIRAMKFCKPGIHEYQVEAELLHEFKINGAQDTAYPSIVASGPHSCILHHRAGKRIMNEGELLLIDAGCELNGYASDITRTFPVSGKFNSLQKQLYELVLHAQNEAIKKAKPGADFLEPHNEAVKVLTSGMIDFGLIKNISLNDAIEKKEYQKFYMHKTGHWLGLDVHDVGSYKKSLSQGMVLTIEPGIYISPSEEIPEEFWNIGIRIEDDVIITDNDCEVITRNAPVDIQEIEICMNAQY
jgi:Xaa-Pro aminopeptidase